jgi:hypothetical protein
VFFLLTMMMLTVMTMKAKQAAAAPIERFIIAVVHS